MKFEIKPDRDVFALFPTPVACFPVENADEINSGIEHAILQRENTDRGLQNSNIGGWQSNLDFIEWPEPEIQELVDSIKCGVLNMVGLVSGIRQFDATLGLVAWANINRQGHFNQVHTHPGNQWSGVYYVAAGQYEEDEIDFPGQLQIHDPRAGAELIPHPGMPFGHPFRIEPKAGMMVIFPAWLGHSVNVFYSQTTRISVSFNAELQSFKAH